MRKNSVIFTTLSLLLSPLFINSYAFAGDIEWSGLYRVEGYQIENSDLKSSEKKKLGYGLSHLELRPKITAGDGITIYGQFDVLNADGTYANSQMGQVWGDGVRNGIDRTATTSQNNSNALSHTMRSETIEVTQLYMTYNNEFGQLLVGRAPLQFGLGMTYSAGRGLFDHFSDTRDLVGYKIVMGNIYFLPMIGRPSGGTINGSDNIDDYMLQAEYENPETDLKLGIFFSLRHGGDQGSDAPLNVGGNADGAVLGGPGTKTYGTMNVKTINMYALRDTERFRLGFEGSFMSGESGVIVSDGDKVEYSGFGLAFEGEYRPADSGWKWGIKGGYASGDDPGTNAKFEGYAFNRNYDVAMLMFNHPLGQNDFLRTGLYTGSVRDAGGNINAADVEMISNAIYLAPTIKYAFNDHWSLDNTFVTGWLNANPIPDATSSKDLGYEWDITLNWMPRKGVAWINQVGALFPGSAWKGGGPTATTYPADMAYGFATKAAISF